MIPHCVRDDKVGAGVFMLLPSNAYPLPLSAEGWVAFGAAGLFVAGQVAYL